MKTIQTKKKYFMALVLLSSIFLLGMNSFAADTDSDDNPNAGEKQGESLDPCLTQKAIWTGFDEPTTYIIPENHKNIFVISEETVIDRVNRLEWKICPEGQQYLDNKCLGSPHLLNWYDAPKKLRGQLYAGRNDWRVPTIDELEGIIDYCTRSGAYFNKKAFPETMSGIYWSSSHDPGFYNEYVAWYVDFATTFSSFLAKDRLARVRAVRSF